MNESLGYTQGVYKDTSHYNKALEFTREHVRAELGRNLIKFLKDKVDVICLYEEEERDGLPFTPGEDPYFTKVTSTVHLFWGELTDPEKIRLDRLKEKLEERCPSS